VTAAAQVRLPAGGGFPKAVVFDLDGTLVDCADLHRHCLRQAVAAVGGWPPSAARLAAAERPTDLGTVLRLVGPDRLETAYRAYLAAFDAGLATRPPAALPAAGAALAASRRHGLSVGICTGRARREAGRLLAATGLDLDVTVAREDCPAPKPAPEGLLIAVGRLGARPGDAVYVGDRPSDAEQGAAAGVATLVLTPQAARCETALSGLVDMIEGRSA
jgi:beta-phosphoglucomutase-like phosphatase (HAD superfamily)